MSECARERERERERMTTLSFSGLHFHRVEKKKKKKKKVVPAIAHSLVSGQQPQPGEVIEMLSSHFKLWCNLFLVQ